MYIPRTLVNQLRHAAATRPSIIVTGARQAGKTTLLKVAFPEASYVTFDNILNVASAQEAPNAFLQRFEGPVILDEVQYVPALFSAIKQKIDENRDRCGQWLLTGSQRFELMKNVSDSLAGRIAVFHLETLSAKELRESGAIGPTEFASILFRGGYPELWAHGDIDKASWFEDYFKTYIERDLKEIVNVRSLIEFRRFMGRAAARCGELVNFSELGQACGVTNNTVKTWMAALELSGLIYILPPYYSDKSKRLVKMPKLYFADTGLVSSLLGIRGEEELIASSFAGHLWENFVLTELIKTEDRAPGKDLFYYRDHSGAEIDFVLALPEGLTLIEAKHMERVRNERLAFEKAEANALGHVAKRRVAAPTGMSQALPMDGFDIYDPRFGS
jgi:hypothetical protein